MRRSRRKRTRALATRVWVPRSSVDHRIATHARCHLHDPIRWSTDERRTQTAIASARVRGLLEAALRGDREWESASARVRGILKPAPTGQILRHGREWGTRASRHRHGRAIAAPNFPSHPNPEAGANFFFPRDLLSTHRVNFTGTDPQAFPQRRTTPQNPIRKASTSIHSSCSIHKQSTI